MDLETMMKETRKAKKQLKKCGADAKFVRISPRTYTEITGRRTIKCGRINGMDVYIDFSRHEDCVITGECVDD